MSHDVSQSPIVSHMSHILKKSALEKRAVSQTTLFCEKTALEKRADYKTALFSRLKGRFDWRDEKSCMRALYAKIVGYAGVKWISAGLLKKSALEKRAVSQTTLFCEKTALEKRADYKSALFHTHCLSL
jgi:ornithine cyclodeaminase/alanine dehydrogenase-like protein (mu-crystallin family)